MPGRRVRELGILGTWMR